MTADHPVEAETLTAQLREARDGLAEMKSHLDKAVQSLEGTRVRGWSRSDHASAVAQLRARSEEVATLRQATGRLGRDLSAWLDGVRSPVAVETDSFPRTCPLIFPGATWRITPETDGDCSKFTTRSAGLFCG